MKSHILLILTLLTSSFSFSQTGRIKGVIYDRKENIGISGAYITIENRDSAIYSDPEGNFEINNLKTGIYKLRICSMPYDTTITNIRVKESKVTKLKILLPPACIYDKKDKTCPQCKKKKNVIKILYGLILPPHDKTKYFYAGCQITDCDPKWYCKNCKIKF